MKKFLLSGAIILAFVLYAIRGHFGDSNTINSQPSNTDSTSVSPDTNTTTPTPTPTPTTPTPNPSPISVVTRGQYKDGQYTGSVADAFYGLLQVKAIISGGRITDVVFLQYPNDQRESQQVNGFSNPRLKQEAISAQSANVDTVSGATQSSGAFRESLASALALAK
jgi:uncharacterized protein with FMN-binding domain